MANKLDTEKALFLGKTPVREATTFGAIRKAVHELNKGEGVSYADLEKHLIENFKPGKSENYGPSYVKAYVRDAVNKFGYLSHENLGAEYEVVAPVEKKEATEAEKPKKLTKAQQSRVDVLALVRDRGDVKSTDDLNATQISTTSIMEETKKKQKTVDTLVADLEKEGFVRVDDVEGTKYVFLTEAGYKHVNDHAPVVNGDTGEPAEQTAAETASSDDDDTSEA